MKVWESTTFWNSALALAAYIGGNALGVAVPWELAATIMGGYAIKEAARHTAEGKVEVERLAAWKGNPMRVPTTDVPDAPTLERRARIAALRSQLAHVEAELAKTEASE